MGLVGRPQPDAHPRGKGLGPTDREAPVNAARNGLFAFRLPVETVRRGAKREELAERSYPSPDESPSGPTPRGTIPSCCVACPT